MIITRWTRSQSVGPIGLDVGRSGVRLVQLQRTPDGCTVRQAAVWQRPPMDAVDDQDSAAVEQIACFLRQTDFRGCRAITGLSAPQVELHPLELPAGGGAGGLQQLHKAAAWEIQRLTTFGDDPLQTAVWPVPTSRRTRTTCMGVAARRDRVLEIYHLCEAAGLNCSRIDVASCAISSLAWQLRERPADQVWGVLDLGHTCSRLAMCIDDSPVMVRTFEVGGAMWTERIAAALKLRPAAAERIKRDVGLQPGRGADGEATRAAHAVIMDILVPDLQRLAQEIERSYEYVLQWYAPRAPGDLVMVGGGAMMNGLEVYLAGQLGIAVTPIGRCPSNRTAMLLNNLQSGGSLETCAEACAYSMQGFEDLG